MPPNDLKILSFTPTMFPIIPQHLSVGAFWNKPSQRIFDGAAQESEIVIINSIPVNAVTKNINIEDVLLVNGEKGFSSEQEATILKCRGNTIVCESENWTWLKRTKLSPDCQSCNLMLCPGSNPDTVKLKSIRQINPNEQILLWFSPPILNFLQIPFLTPANIKGSIEFEAKNYICDKCDYKCEMPNPLKIHLSLDCDKKSTDHLWNRLRSISNNESDSPDEPFLNFNKGFSFPKIFNDISFTNETNRRDFLVKNSKNIREILGGKLDLAKSEKSDVVSISTNIVSNEISKTKTDFQAEMAEESKFKNNRNPKIFSAFKPYDKSQNLSDSKKLTDKRETKHTRTPENVFDNSFELLLVPEKIEKSEIYFPSGYSDKYPEGYSSYSSGYFRYPEGYPSHPLNSRISHPLNVTDIYEDKKAAEIETIVSNLGRFQQGHLCVYCGKVYSRKYGLKIHIRTHTGFKPLKCKFCLRPFGDPSNLNKHVRLHSEGDTPYKCEICQKILVRRRDLERHIKSRHQNENTSDIRTT